MARMCSINLADRDGLHNRLSDVLCPVLWMHGTEDLVYSIANAKEEIPKLVNSKHTELRVVEGGAHFLSASNPEVVDPAVLEFIQKWHGKGAAA
jgi:pimeloyl-ACP methyl ester carboxylesterase